MKAVIPPTEQSRLKNIESYSILDTPPEQVFDDLAKLAGGFCETPFALVSFVDEARAWFKSKTGIESTGTSRDVAFCSYAILQSEVFVVRDARADQRFAENPLVCAEPHIRFYAGAPLITPEGFAIGTLCVFSREPRQLRPDQLQALQILARQVVHELVMRRMESRRSLEEQRRRGAEEQYRLLIENTPEGVVRSGVDGKLLFANPAMARMLGYDSPEDLLHCHNDLGYPLYVDTEERLGLASQLIRRRRAIAYQCRLFRKDRSIVWIRGSGRMVRNTGEVPLFFEGIVGDITEQKRIETALRESEERFRSLAGYAPVGIFQTDALGNRTYVNERWCGIL